MWNQEVARLRIHVERLIRHIREFRALSVRCPISRKDLLSKLAFCCTMLQNFALPVGGVDYKMRKDGGACSAYSLLWGDL